MRNKKELPEKMDLKSMNVGADNRAKLKQLFPSVFTETKNKDGEVVESIDFDKLKAELGKFSDTYEKRRERYGMDWPGKKDCMKLIQKPSVATLKPCREESVNFDNTENLFIEGDNLEVLKLLQKSYYGKIKMIYIDPPYNTGKEFIYPDDYSESLETYLAYAGLVDDEGKKFSTNTPNEGRFHTKWLNMMHPRLYLSRNLLKEDGVIVISIDDNEYLNLRTLCNEVFGEENFIESFIWKKSYGGGAKEKYAVTQHEYILMYCKNIDWLPDLWLPPDPKAVDKYYKHRDEKYFKRGPYRLKPLEATKSMDDRENLIYPIPLPNGKEIWPERQWWWGRTRTLKALENNELEFTKSKNRVTVQYKQYLRDEDGTERGAKPFSVIDNIYTQQGTADLKSIFNGVLPLQFPKPIELMKFFLQLGSDPNKKEIVLDFFAGSSTLAQAVIEYNASKLSNYKFIMAQLPEPCEEKSDAFKAGYKNIAEIGKERIRRVINKIGKEQAAKAKEAKEKLPGMADNVPQIDLGFKVLKLDKSNFKIWDGAKPDAPEEKIAKQLEMFVEHIDPKATQEDILYELLLKAGYLPTEKIKEIKLADKTVYSISGGSLLICLEDQITSDLIHAVAESAPLQFICLDRGFQGNDQLKANAVQTFAALNQNREKAEQIIFRTV